MKLPDVVPLLSRYETITFTALLLGFCTRVKSPSRPTSVRREGRSHREANQARSSRGTPPPAKVPKRPNTWLFRIIGTLDVTLVEKFPVLGMRLFMKGPVSRVPGKVNGARVPRACWVMQRQGETALLAAVGF